MVIWLYLACSITNTKIIHGDFIYEGSKEVGIYHNMELPTIPFQLITDKQFEFLELFFNTYKSHHDFFNPNLTFNDNPLLSDRKKYTSLETFASLLHGFNHYWLPLQKYYSELKVEDQPVKEEDYQPLLSDLKDHIESSYTTTQKINEFEGKFERRYPFGYFTDLHDRQTEFIKFIEELSKPKEITPKESPPKVIITREVVEKSPIQEEEPLPSKTPVQAENIFRKCIAYLTPQIHGVGDLLKLIFFLSLAALVNFYIFWGLASQWPIFDVEYFLIYYPFFVPFQIIMFPFIILLSSFVIGKLFYFVILKISNRIKKNQSQ